MTDTRIREARAQIVGWFVALDAELTGDNDADSLHDTAQRTYKEMHIIGDETIRWVCPTNHDMILVWPDDTMWVARTFGTAGERVGTDITRPTAVEAFGHAWAYYVADGHGINHTGALLADELALA